MERGKNVRARGGEGNNERHDIAGAHASSQLLWLTTQDQDSPNCSMYRGSPQPEELRAAGEGRATLLWGFSHWYDPSAQENCLTPCKEGPY